MQWIGTSRLIEHSLSVPAGKQVQQLRLQSNQSQLNKDSINHVPGECNVNEETTPRSSMISLRKADI